MAATAVYRAGLGLGGSGRERPGRKLPQAFHAQACVTWSRRGARTRAAVRDGGNGGAAAASGSAAGDGLYGAGMGGPSPRGNFLSIAVRRQSRLMSRMLWWAKNRMAKNRIDVIAAGVYPFREKVRWLYICRFGGLTHIMSAVQASDMRQNVVVNRWYSARYLTHLKGRRVPC